MLDDYKAQYSSKEQELMRLKSQKEAIDGQITPEGLQNALKSFIDMNYYKPKQQLTNDFLSGKVSLSDFEDKFKNLNQNFHYYSIVKDKLNQCK